MTLAEELRASGIKSQHQINLEKIIEKLTERLKSAGQTHPKFASGWGFMLEVNCYDISYMNEVAEHFRNEGLTVQTRYSWEVYDMTIYVSK